MGILINSDDYLSSSASCELKSEKNKGLLSVAFLPTSLMLDVHSKSSIDICLGIFLRPILFGKFLSFSILVLFV